MMFFASVFVANHTHFGALIGAVNPDPLVTAARDSDLSVVNLSAVECQDRRLVNAGERVERLLGGEGPESYGPG